MTIICGSLLIAAQFPNVKIFCRWCSSEVLWGPSRWKWMGGVWWFSRGPQTSKNLTYTVSPRWEMCSRSCI